MRNLLGMISLICGLTIGHFSMAGGGWTYNKGKGYFKLAQNMILSDYYFGPKGDLIDLSSRISLYTTSIYAEYGITDRITAVGYIPFFVRSTLNSLESGQTGMTIREGDQINSFGDTDLGIKYGFFQDKPVVMTVSVTFGLPFGHSDVSVERILQTGDGEFNQLIKLEASHSLYPLPFYITALLGFNNRTKGFSEEFHYGVEIGYTSERFYTNVKLYSKNSLYNGSAGDTQANGVFANNTEYFSYGPEMSYLFCKKTGVTACAGFAFSGKRILAAPNFGFGFFMNL